MADVDKEAAVNPSQGRRVAERLRFTKDSLPGRRDGLPKGALGGLPRDPQGDEHREPPPEAPTVPP
jgi:hypothetical protein